jgi:hypothetical protein
MNKGRCKGIATLKVDMKAKMPVIHGLQVELAQNIDMPSVRKYGNAPKFMFLNFLF